MQQEADQEESLGRVKETGRGWLVRRAESPPRMRTTGCSLASVNLATQQDRTQCKCLDARRTLIMHSRVEHATQEATTGNLPVETAEHLPREALLR